LSGRTRAQCGDFAERTEGSGEIHRIQIISRAIIFLPPAETLTDGWGFIAGREVNASGSVDS